MFSTGSGAAEEEDDTEYKVEADKTHVSCHLAYSWVNENWDFLVENYVILEYFLTRNM